VPGIILALMYALTFFLLAEYTLAVERGEMQKSAVAAWTTCKRSAEMMNGWKLKFFLYGIVLGLVALSGVLMLGIGLLFTAPLAIMSTVVLYEKIRRIGPLALFAFFHLWQAPPLQKGGACFSMGQVIMISHRLFL